MIRVLAVLLFASLTGCYSYRPVPAGVLQPGQRVQVTLNEAGTRELAASVGPSTSTISGRIVGDGGDALLVSVHGTRTHSGREADWAGEQVSIERSLVAELRERQFSRSRTVAAGLAIIVAGVLVREAFMGPGGAFGGAPPGGPVTPR